jgi:hypothetical protein
MGKHCTYINIFGYAQATHILPKYVHNKILGREISYKKMEEWIISFLAESSKIIWPRFPIKVGRFTLLNISHARNKAAVLKELCLCKREARIHEPKGIVRDHIKYVGLINPLMHDANES